MNDPNEQNFENFQMLVFPLQRKSQQTCRGLPIMLLYNSYSVYNYNSKNELITNIYIT